MKENYLANMDRYIGFPYLINRFCYTILGEIGIREGFHADHLLSAAPGTSVLYGIDCDVSSPNLHTVKQKHGDRFEIVSGFSPSIATISPDNHFDFIHIDGNHLEEAVYADLVAWYPKLKIGGCFCGDDFMLAHDHPSEGRFGVVEAVERWSIDTGITYYVTGLDSVNFKDKYEYAKEMWEILRERKHFNYPRWQIPQWWTIKGGNNG